MRIVVVIDSVPSYRRGFYKQLLANPSIDLTVYCQSHIKGFNLQLIHKELGDNFIEVPFISSGTHQWAWQRLPVRHLWKNFDVYFFHGNPRVISSLVWATIFRLFGKKIVIWGQAHTAGSNPVTEAVRLRWWRLFRNVLAYTDSEVEYLRRRGFGDRNILGMNNGLDQDDIEKAKAAWSADRLRPWQESHKLSGKTVLLSCARLVEKNCFQRVVESLPRLIETTPRLVWCVIGSGSEYDSLNRLAKKLNVADHVVWVGEIYNEDDLAPWFLSSAMLVHPGAIGLTLMHAFGYGLPVITHDNTDFQMPEIAAFENDVNGLYFRQNDSVSLTETINLLLDDRSKIVTMSAAALETVREQYNTSAMAQRFVRIAEIAEKS